MKKNLKVLVADDNKHFLNAFQYILVDGFEEYIEKIHLAQSGKECLEILSKEMVDVCFLDVEMPNMNGIELTKQIVEKYRGMLIIALSFHEEMTYVKQMIDAGARFYIIKEDINQKQIQMIFDMYF